MNKKLLISSMLFGVVVGFISPNTYAGTSRATIAMKLFKLPSTSMNYNYNPWGNPDPSKAGKCLGYDGGHSGIDIQTTDKSTARAFYALAKGVVVRVGGTSYYNSISVYDSANNRTVTYLHASSVNVYLNKTINAGDLLGFQGSTGANGAVHVHTEVRSGKQLNAACGAVTTINPENITW